jgi:hypothetical protein
LPGIRPDRPLRLGDKVWLTAASKHVNASLVWLIGPYHSFSGEKRGRGPDRLAAAPRIIDPAGCPRW